ATFQRIKDLILNHQDIGVVVRPNPTLDEMAAGLGMYLSLKLMGKNASIACPTDPIVALSSLVGIDKVTKTLSGGGAGGDLTVTFPYQEGEIEKVSYTLDNGKLNIVVKAGEKGLSFSQQDVEFIRSGGTAASLVFFVGVPRMTDVASVVQPVPGQTQVVNIDNKPENEKYGDVAVVDGKWSSVSEQIADFVTLLEPQIELDPDTAQNLLTGIDSATQDFTSPRTSYLAFEVAGILMKKGATRQQSRAIAQNAQSSGMNQQEMNTYFPPTQPSQPQPVQTQPVQQPVQQFVSQPQPAQQTYTPMQNPQAWQPQPVQTQPMQQPVQQPAWQAPIQQPMQTQPVQQPELKKEEKQTPPDWLTPKVYKGSTIL
ncbi:MAG: hypothetical protein KGL95_11810, partial [Patescibacteria group bacterium]|nr:hypothetical protein [Patescibacteria group bacterium]